MRQLKMQNWNHYNEELCSVVFITDEPVDTKDITTVVFPANLLANVLQTNKLYNN